MNKIGQKIVAAMFSERLIPIAIGLGAIGLAVLSGAYGQRQEVYESLGELIGKRQVELDGLLKQIEAHQAILAGQVPNPEPAAKPAAKPA